MFITLKQGKILGIEEKSIPSNKTYHSFFGIPYAEPPVNHLRFKAPEPVNSWNGILDATKPSNVCTQKDFYSAQCIGDEDCLYINVHVPGDSKNSKNLKPVMVFIHGGAFMMGSGDGYSAEYLMEYDVILITVNYRLHVLGFLNLGLPECSGNMGLKDLVLALKWVKENIKEFGGDDANVTIFGESAGSVAVTFLMMSPMARNLFHKAIAQSGHSFCKWAFTNEPLKHAFDLGTVLGYRGSPSDRKKLLNFLLQIPARDLINAQFKLLRNVGKNLFSQLIFVPSLEFDVDPNNSFLPDNLEALMKNMSPMPLMTGLNDLEGLILVGGIGELESSLSKFNNQIRAFMPSSWRTLPDGLLTEIADKIKKFYFKDKKICKENFQLFVEMLSDANFNVNFYNIPCAILENDPKTPIYIYHFSYVGELNFLKMLLMSILPDCTAQGSSHGDDLFYLFKVKRSFAEFNYSSEKEKELINTMCSFWSNFARTGIPTPMPCKFQWKPLTPNKFHYLHIDKNILMKEGRIFEYRLHFWEALLNEIQLTKKATQLNL